MKYAWIENGRIKDICNGAPENLYHSDIAVHYNTLVPDAAENGDGWVNGELVKPVITPQTEPEPVVTYPKVSPIEFKLLFTSAERIGIKVARQSDPVLDDFYEILEDHRLEYVDMGLESVRQGIGYLALKGLITSERMNEVLTGTFK